MSTMAQLKAARDRLQEIESALQTWQRVSERLRLINKYGEPGTRWSVEICLHKDAGWGRTSINITAKLPFEVVQQQAVYDVSAAERAIRMLGGEVPAAGPCRGGTR